MSEIRAIFVFEATDRDRDGSSEGGVGKERFIARASLDRDGAGSTEDARSRRVARGA